MEYFVCFSVCKPLVHKNADVSPGVWNRNVLHEVKCHNGYVGANHNTTMNVWCEADYIYHKLKQEWYLKIRYLGLKPCVGKI